MGFGEVKIAAMSISPVFQKKNILKKVGAMTDTRKLFDSKFFTFLTDA
ncbi:MAG: hypothetical protein ACJAQ4_001323 [Cryomorphaceae bacterium]|jgi:hypothetical protein